MRSATPIRVHGNTARIERVGNERGFEGAKSGTGIDCQVVAGSESQTFTVITSVDGSRFSHT